MGTSRTARRATAVVTALFLLSPVTAVAGPDDGKAIATKKHIDAPKTFWEGDSFSLKTNLGHGNNVPLEDTVVWVGKGWGRGASTYQFTVPDDPAMAFLGEEGTVVYAAPQNPYGTRDPVWLGYGADSELPIDSFLDSKASLDLISVNGPGRVDKFVWHEGPYGFRHLLSSANGPRSVYLTRGTHTHNYTTFTRPGRYELTYRTVARDHNGTIISSELTTLPIQVGGKQPHDTPTPSTMERYNNAPEGNLADAGYTLSVAPNETHEKDGDEHLSTLTFTAKDTSLEGTLTLFINGYFLTDLDVTKGTASWNEHLGPLDSTLQAVFTPKGTTGARWISPTLAYTKGSTNTVTSDHGNAKLAEPTNDPANTVLPTEDYTPTTLNYIATIDPLGEKRYKVAVEFEDTKIDGFLRGGLYSSPADTFVTHEFETFIKNGRAELTFEDFGYSDYEIRLELLPHPLINAGGVTAVMPERHSDGKSQRTQGALLPALTTSPPPTTSPLPRPTPEPAPGDDPEVCTPRPVIERGHVDIAATGGKTDLGIVLKDDTNTTPGVKERRLDSVVLGVHNNARKERTDAFKDPFFDIVDPKGPFYLLPATQNPDIIWPGYNTQSIDYTGIDGTVDLHINIADGPKNGHVAMFHDELGSFTPVLNTATDDTTINITYATHVHTNWIFTQPGTYTLNIWYTARTKTGKDLTSEVQQATFAIGNDAVATAKDPRNCTTPTPPPNPGDDHGTGPSTPGQSGDQSSGSSLGAGATAGIAAAAVIGAGLLALLAANIPAITGWLSNLTGR
ncbi:choice-of-anchor M domain-containing protein [Corynebacterium timonense]|uniref:Surface-anchored protein n=1 Tax=Corynebacterium timonense TaxID=441500 RepID=A0A1H1PX40_9CORY|nr:choice-of-anchor M domain-containing protein [Corynebacterium timonense]SDS15249.1 surface-anchored protein [Corynebacterium timonense]